MNPFGAARGTDDGSTSAARLARFVSVRIRDEIEGTGNIGVSLVYQARADVGRTWERDVAYLRIKAFRYIH